MATTSTPRTNPARKSTPPPTKSGGRGGGGRPTKPKRKGSPFWGRVKTVFTLLSIFVLLSVLTLMAWVALRIHDTPRTIDIDVAPMGITYLYSSDGQQIAEFFTERRKVVPIEDIPKNLQDATVAFEDKRFYSHSGVDFRGIERALYSNFRHGDMKGEGGSTITQQLARNAGVEGLDRKKSFGRKFNELIIANQIEKSYTKQDILAKYLNLVNYGSGAYGVEAAAEVYFNKHVKQLDLAQCALLAGLPNRPADFSPYKDMEAAKGQRGRVLQQMLEQGKITPAQFNQAIKEPIKLAGAKAPPQGSQIFHAPFFVNYVVDQLRRKYGPDRLFEGNLKVYTTLNWEMQQAAEKELVEGIDRARRAGHGPTQGCLVALDPKTGGIKAMVGGVNYKQSQFNIVTQARRQPGSSFKAVVYSAAIDLGSLKERDTILDAPITFRSGGKPYTPKDDSGYTYRRVTLREAMAQSINVPAIKVTNAIGPQNVVRYARMMGVKSPLDPYLALALGSSGVTPLEMASVYSTFAAGGDHAEPAAWTRLTDAQGNVLEDVPPSVATHVLQKDTVAQLNDMLGAVVTEGTARNINGIVADAHGKTGTTQGHKDVWFVGYTHDLVCAVWAGHPVYQSKNKPPTYGEPMAGGAWGSTVCAPIWAKFMSRGIPIFQAARAREIAQKKAKQTPVAKPLTPADTAAAADNPPAPSDNSGDTPRRRSRRNAVRDNGDGTVTVNVDDGSSLLAPNGSAGSHPETFTAGTEPTALSPQYTPSGGDSAGDNSSSDGSSPSASGTDGSSSGNSSRSSRRSRRSRRSADSGDNVSVMVNPEDGLLATKWDPQTVRRSFPRGQEPRTYSQMYPPPPGEQ